MEVIPNSINSHNSDSNKVNSQRMLRLSQILQGYSVDSRARLNNRENLSNIGVGTNRLKNSPSLYKVAIKIGIIIGIILGCITGGIFLIISR